MTKIEILNKYKKQKHNTYRECDVINAMEKYLESYKQEQALQLQQDAVMQSVLKASDLRINNFISDIHATDKFYGVVNKVHKDKVYYSGFFSKIEDVRGIPLTEEWLNKLGLNVNKWFCENSYCVVEDKTGDTSYGWCMKVQNASHTKEIEFGYFKYVHELQNLYYALTGSELTVA